MEKKAEHVVENIGAIAETTSIFYNTISKQVPKDVALILTQHFMDLTIARRPAGNPAAAAAAAAAKIAEQQRRAALQQKNRMHTDEAPAGQPENQTPNSLDKQEENSENGNS